MSNINLNISINDFENICRTCLSREDLMPLYEKCSLSMLCAAEKLMSFGFLQFAEDDGLPVKICKLCIQEINQSFSFAKRCETTDAILRNCLKIKTEFENDSSESQKRESILEVEEEIKIDIKQEINFSDTDAYTGDAKQIKTEFANDLSESQKRESIIEMEEEIKIDIKPEINFSDTDEYIGDVKQEDNAKLEFKQEIILPIVYQSVQEMFKDYNEIEQQVADIKFEEVKPTENVNIDYECDDNDESYVEDSNESEDKTDFEKCDLGSAHKRKVTLNSQLKNVCSLCNKAFVCPSKLQIHMRIHTGEKPYSCKVCSKTFSISTSLTRHNMRLHTAEKPYTCEVCSKAFTRSSDLKSHMITHTGEKPYKCDLCSKNFSLSTSLTRHMRLHTAEKPYTCEVCSKAFSRSFGLKSHMIIHRGEKPYSCNVCSRPFAHVSALKNHMSLHTREKPFNCGICSKPFINAYSLKFHLRMHT